MKKIKEGVCSWCSDRVPMCTNMIMLANLPGVGMFEQDVGDLLRILEDEGVLPGIDLKETTECMLRARSKQAMRAAGLHSAELVAAHVRRHIGMKLVCCQCETLIKQHWLTLSEFRAKNYRTFRVVIGFPQSFELPREKLIAVKAEPKILMPEPSLYALPLSVSTAVSAAPIWVPPKMEFSPMKMPVLKMREVAIDFLPLQERAIPRQMTIPNLPLKMEATVPMTTIEATMIVTAYEKAIREEIIKEEIANRKKYGVSPRQLPRTPVQITIVYPSNAKAVASMQYTKGGGYAVVEPQGVNGSYILLDAAEADKIIVERILVLGSRKFIPIRHSPRRNKEVQEILDGP
jgi:hypothetical protein